MTDSKKRKAKIQSRGQMPPELLARWRKSLAAAEADRAHAELELPDILPKT